MPEKIIQNNIDSRMKLIFDHSFDAIVGMDEDGLITSWNKKAEKMFGWSQEEVLGRRVGDVIVPQQYREAHHSGLRRFLTTGESGVINKQLEVTGLHKDGHEFFIEISISCAKNEGRHFFIAYIHDMTDRRKFESTLQRISFGVSSETGEAFFLKLALHLAKLFESDYAFVSELVDDEMVRTLAVCANGKIIDNFTYSLKDTPCFNVMTQATCIYYCHVQKYFPEDHMLGDMHAESYVGTALLDSDGRAIGLIAVVDSKPMEKISHIKNILEIFSARASSEMVRLRAEERIARFSRIFENSLNEIYLFDAQTLEFLQVNKGARQNLDYSIDELKKLTPLDIKPEFTKESFLELIDPLSKKEKEIIDFETVHKRKDGSLYPVEIRLQLFSNESPPLFVAIIQDITKRKHSEEMRESLMEELQQKNTEVERFVYIVSHDLKSPLITIGGFIGFLKRALKSGKAEEIKMYIKRIEQAADKMQTLLGELLRLSRIGHVRNPFEDVSLKEIAEEAVEILFLENKDTKIKVNISSKLPVISGDRVKLMEVFQNLMENAIKFMGKQSSPCIDVGVRTQGQEQVYFVQDNGAGVKADYFEKIFNIFDRVNPKIEGTGVGLAIVKRVVELHHGRVWVESAGEGKGSTFCFTLQEKKKENGN